MAAAFCFLCNIQLCFLVLQIVMFAVRSYPLPFGLRVMRLVSQTKNFQVGSPPELTGDAPATFQALEWGDPWPEARLLEACVYLRGSVHLVTSTRWKYVFPTHIDEV